MFKCLQENLAKPQFGQACKEQVEQRTQTMQEDYRLDYGVSSSCETDVDLVCFTEKVPPVAPALPAFWQCFTPCRPSLKSASSSCTRRVAPVASLE